MASSFVVVAVVVIHSSPSHCRLCPDSSRLTVKICAFLLFFFCHHRRVNAIDRPVTSYLEILQAPFKMPTSPTVNLIIDNSNCNEYCFRLEGSIERERERNKPLRWSLKHKLFPRYDGARRLPSLPPQFDYSLIFHLWCYCASSGNGYRVIYDYLVGVWWIKYIKIDRHPLLFLHFFYSLTLSNRKMFVSSERESAQMNKTRSPDKALKWNVFHSFKLPFP